MRLRLENLSFGPAGQSRKSPVIGQHTEVSETEPQGSALTDQVTHVSTRLCGFALSPQYPAYLLPVISSLTASW